MAVFASKCITLHTHLRILAPLWVPAIKVAALQVVTEAKDGEREKKKLWQRLLDL